MRPPSSTRLKATTAARAALFALAAAVRPSFAEVSEGTEGRGRGDTKRSFSCPLLRVEIQGSVSLTPDALSVELATRAGDPYDAAVLDNDIRSLMNTGRYRSVRWSGPRREGEGVVLTLTVEERPVLGKIEYRGVKSVGADDAASEARRIGLLAGPRERHVEARAFRLARRLEELYRGKGLFLAEVRYFTEALEGETLAAGVPSVKLVFDIEEGTPAPIRGVRFVGNRIYTDRQLWRVVRELLGRSAVRGASAKGFDRLRFERVLRYVEKAMYRSRGHLDARVELKEVELFTLAPPGKRKRQWIVPRVEIDEGPIYRAGRIAIEILPAEGEEPFEVTEAEIMSVITDPGDEFAARIPLAEGDVYSDGALEQAARRVRSLLGHHGRITSVVKSRRVLPEEGTAIDVGFVVKPSRIYRVGDWHVRGNTKTRPGVFLRELYYAGIKRERRDSKTGEVVPGETVDTRKLGLAERNIRFTGLVKDEYDEGTGEFVRRDVNIRPFPREDGTVDLAVDVNEGDTGMLQMGVTLTSNNEVAGQIEFVQRNFNLFGLPRSPTDWTNAFTGAGQTFSTSASFGTVSSFLRVDFEEPYFLGLPVRLGLGYSDKERDFGPYTDSRVGWRGSLWRSWSLHPYKRRRLGVSLRFRDEGVAISEISSTVPADFLTEQGFSRLRRWGVGLSYDSRDNRFRPSQGWHASLTQESVGGALGGDKDFNTTKFDFQSHTRLSATETGLPYVLQLRVRASYSAPERTAVPFYERYYAGGIGTLRGFDFRSVGPKDPPGDPYGTPIGGNLRLLETLEYTFPMSPDDSIRGAIYYDAGNVWAKGSEFDFGDQKQAAGVGIQMFPGGGAIPIAIYLGWIINGQPEDDSQVVSFMIGTMFF